MFRVNSDLVN